MRKLIYMRLSHSFNFQYRNGDPILKLLIKYFTKY